MPIYEYRCPRCDDKFEELVGFSQCDDPRACPSCGSEARRLLSTFAVKVAGATPATAGKSCSGCRKSSCASC